MKMTSELFFRRGPKRLMLWLLCVSLIFMISANALAEVKQSNTAEIKIEENPQTNKLITINFKDTEMREVLNILAYKSGINIIAGEDVDAKVTMQLKNVAWKAALEAILQTYNYTYREEENLIRVMSLQRAQEEENKVPLVTEIIFLNFAGVDSIRGSLAKILSPRGSIETDPRTNSLIVTDVPDAVIQVKAAAVTLDTLTPQVMIEALMVEVTLTEEDRMGVEWFLNQKGTFWDSASGLTNNQNGFSFGTSTDLTSAQAKSSANLNFGGTSRILDITGLIEVWQSNQKAEILANPKVITLDNQEAKIEILEEIPYIETVADPSGSGTKDTVKFKEAGVKLSVTPHVTQGGYISMNVKPEQSFQSGSILNQPIIDTRIAETNLLVRDGQTVIIGGLRKREDSFTYEKVPYLGDVPFLGLLFRRKLRIESDTELLLFVTPRIVRMPELSDREQKWFDKLESKPMKTFDDRTEMQKFKAWKKERKIKKDDAISEAIKEVEKQALVTKQTIQIPEKAKTNITPKSKPKTVQKTTYTRSKGKRVGFEHVPKQEPKADMSKAVTPVVIDPETQKILDSLKEDSKAFENLLTGIDVE